VRRCDEAVRLDGALDENVLAPGLARCLQEEQALAGDGVLDHISLADHLTPFQVVLQRFLLKGSLCRQGVDVVGRRQRFVLPAEMICRAAASLRE
jgi:hypothetical protein